MIDLLYPAYQKFYNALNNLDKFEKNKNFFENINYLDNFFSEYRNVTFVLQKSLAHTDYLESYNHLRDKLLKNNIGKWFIDKRNSVVKESPFPLNKIINISLFSPNSAVVVYSNKFTINNDIEISALKEEIKDLFDKIRSNEIFFSIGYLFTENENDSNLFKTINEGILKMLELLNSLKTIINQDSTLVDKLEKEINKINFYKIPSDFLMNDDYVYYKDTQSFERGSKIKLMLTDDSDKLRIPLESLKNTMYFSSTCNLFEDFTIMHVIIRSMQNSLMPTFIKIFSDFTYNIYSFDGSLKSTLYRTVNSIANEIEKDNIVQIIFITEVQIINIENNKDYNKILNMTSKDRMKLPHLDMLCSFSVDIHLNIKRLMFESNKLKDNRYVGTKISEQIESKQIDNEDSLIFLSPIIKEFRRIGKFKK